MMAYPFEECAFPRTVPRLLSARRIAARVHSLQLTDPVVTPSKPCLPLTVTLVPLGALSLTSRLPVQPVNIISQTLVSSGALTLANVVEVLVDELKHPSAPITHSRQPMHDTNIIRGLANVAEGGDGHGGNQGSHRHRLVALSSSSHLARDLSASDLQLKVEEGAGRNVDLLVDVCVLTNKLKRSKVLIE